MVNIFFTQYIFLKLNDLVFKISLFNQRLQDSIFFFLIYKIS
jgi:hypothetical protein